MAVAAVTGRWPLRLIPRLARWHGRCNPPRCHKEDTVERRGFLIRIAGGLAALPLAAKLAGCAVEDDAGNLSFAVTNSDASGHSHSFEIKCSHATADGWTYVADGAHTHEVNMTAAQLQQVFDGGTVTINTTDGHAHTWVIAMPGSACTPSSGGGGGGGGGW